MFERSLAEFHRIEEDEKVYTSQLAHIATTHPIAERLMRIPGVGVLTATAALAVVSTPQEFKTGHHFAAFLGLVPRQHSMAVPFRSRIHYRSRFPSIISQVHS